MELQSLQPEIEKLKESTDILEKLIVQNYTFNYVGSFDFFGNKELRISFTKKPHWFRLLILRLLLGSKWIDLKNKV